MSNKTAILVFANSSEHEVLRKHLPKHAVEVLNTSTIKMVKATGLPYFHFSEKEQTGKNFAERFTNAITSVFNKGFDNVITVGNDTPHLTKKHIKKSVEALNINDCVLGLSNDGGFYLMGLRKSHFNANTFLKLPWQKKYLARVVSATLKANNTQTYFLEKLQDIDSSEDFQSILNTIKTTPFLIRKVIVSYFTNIKFVDSLNIRFPKFFSLHHYFNKGSPL